MVHFHCKHMYVRFRFHRSNTNTIFALTSFLVNSYNEKNSTYFLVTSLSHSLSCSRYETKMFYIQFTGIFTLPILSVTKIKTKPNVIYGMNNALCVRTTDPILFACRVGRAHFMSTVTLEEVYYVLHTHMKIT